MADTYDITLTIKKNGLALSDYNPLVRRITCDESQPFSYEKAATGGFVALPASQLDIINLLLLLPDQQVTLRLDAQTDAGLVLNAGGLLLIVNGVLDAGASTNATVDNSSGATTTLKGLASGT